MKPESEKWHCNSPGNSCDMHADNEDKTGFLDFKFFPVSEDSLAIGSNRLLDHLLLDLDEPQSQMRQSLLGGPVSTSQFQQNDDISLRNHIFVSSAKGLNSKAEEDSQSQQSLSIPLDTGASYSSTSARPKTNPSSSFSSPVEPLEHRLLPTSSSEDIDGNQRFTATHQEKWNLRFKEFLIFVEENGNDNITKKYPNNPQLARWVKRQRYQYKLLQDGRPSTMTAERINKLNSVGFVWDSQEISWGEKLNLLKEFSRKHGHCNVPAKYQEHNLGTWVKCQRRQYKLYQRGQPSAMTSDRIMKLEQIGFEWELRNVL